MNFFKSLNLKDKCLTRINSTKANHFIEPSELNIIILNDVIKDYLIKNVV